MIRGLVRLAACLSVLACALCGAPACADTTVALSRSFAGNVNFTGTEVTMRTKNNNRPCSVVSSGTTLDATLSGIPAGAQVVSAQLYWAGSNSQANADYSVVFDGAAVSAPAARRYFSASIGSGYDYFAGGADVTAQVAAKGNGTYTFSGLSINNGNPWCSTEAVLGGFSLVVVYSSTAEPYRVLNLYEGFQYFRYSGITLGLNNFLVPKTLDDSVTARLAHITWEGDSSLNQGGEQLLFNGAEMTDKMNPSGNQFNSASNIIGDSRSWGIDFDAYAIAPSSSLFKPGQSSATTRYQSGQDLVLLQAEVIAMPNVPAADLSITMSRAAPLQVGADAAYTIGVANAGPNTESGPVTVTDNVPAGMGFISASGTGWSCTASGQAVTCSAAGPLAAGASLPPLTLVLRPTAAGTYTNSATVAGQMFDNVPGNSSASDTGTASAAAVDAWAFTTVPCQAGAALGSGACPVFAGPVTAGASATVYVTALSGSPAAATPVSTSADTTVPLRFALSCVDPTGNRGVGASFAGVALPLCVADGAAPAPASSAWSAPASLVFAQGKPSAQLTAGFSYEDVGLVALYLLDAASHQAAAHFAVKPATLAFSAIRRTRDGAPNPGPTSGARPGFVRAGESFTLVVGALTASGKWAPNFGYEKNGAWWPQIKLQQVQERELPPVEGAFQSASGGFVTGTGFWWDEAGNVNLAPVLNDYLGAGAVPGAAVDVGRFYPDHFDTATFPPFHCLAAMGCGGAITGAAYSAQPVKVEVRAMGLTGKALTNYPGQAITLSAVASAGGPSGSPNGGAMLDNTGQTAVGDPAATINPRYVLPAQFSSSQPRALNWTAPTATFVRASATESVIDAGGVPRSVVISSRIPSGSVEGGVMTVNGRLQLANAFGSELLKLPVRMNAQFWTGSRWENSATDDSSSVLYAGNLAFSDCQGALATSGGACNTALLAMAPAAPVQLQDGAGSFLLPAPGRGNTGSAWLRVTDGHPAWLPSTRARAAWGVYKSLFIYTREVH